MSVIVVSGTDTDVGKTIITAALSALARSRGERVAVVKPIQTGLRRGEPGDLEEIRRLARVEDVHEFARLAEPLAPATAARRAGVDLPSISEMAGRIEQLRDRDLVLVEGAGGLLVHLDGRGGTLADLALALDAPVLLVARAGLGTLNQIALTCEALERRRITCQGIAIGAWPPVPGLAERCNLEDIPTYADRPLIGWMPAGASALNPDAFLAAAREALTQEVLA